MNVQAIVIACCKILGLLLVYQGCVSLLFGLNYFFVGPVTSQFGVAVHWITPLALFAASFYAIRHADQIAFHLVGDLSEEPATFPQERDFWVHLAYVLLALYFLADGVARVATGVGSVVVHFLAPPSTFALYRTAEGLGGLALLLVVLILLRRSGPRLKELSVPRVRRDEE